MTKRVIEHEIKLQKSVIVILAVLAIGVCANAFAPAFGIKDALAETLSVGKIYLNHSGSISTR